MSESKTQPHTGLFSADFGIYYTSVLWVSSYAPKKPLLKKSLWKNFEPSYYRVGARYYDGHFQTNKAVSLNRTKRSDWSEYSGQVELNKPVSLVWRGHLCDSYVAKWLFCASFTASSGA